MSKRSKPKKTRIRKASSYADNRKRTESKKTREEVLDNLTRAQKVVDKWNLENAGKNGFTNIDLKKHFENIQLEDGLVIQMYMENPIKRIIRDKDTKEVIHVDNSIRQIDNRRRTTDAPNWVNTPFPIIDKGVILSISPRTKLWYHEQKEKLNRYDPKAAEKMLIPEVGDIVYTKLFMFKNKRYYPNKQKKCQDFVKNQEELRLNNFDFLFLIDNYDIEAIVKKDKQKEVSDYQVRIDDRYEDIKVEEGMLKRHKNGKNKQKGK